ncbi:MAG TPA: hypothetical protein VFA66_10545 [Gaiellaceae bacterium]|nr:hypothetical protein [Gaiellaceae bacterium]
MFLEALAAGWSVTHAALRAGVARQRLYERRETDEGFAEAWADAYRQGTDALEDEARRRAVEGWEEPVFQRGELVGHVRRYDSRLLEFLLRARDPARFRENATVEVTGGGGGPVRVRREGAASLEAVFEVLREAGALSSPSGLLGLPAVVDAEVVEEEGS